jgi:hypothetical protein
MFVPKEFAVKNTLFALAILLALGTISAVHPMSIYTRPIKMRAATTDPLRRQKMIGTMIVVVCAMGVAIAGCAILADIRQH